MSSISSPVTIRPLTASDGPFLREALYHALYIPSHQSPPPRSILQEPALAIYIAGWGRAGDMGTIAEADGEPVGACWMRLWQGHERGYGYIDAQTPELSLSVLPEWRRRGIGTRLLSEALTIAGKQYPTISLSVTTSNPALRLYSRFGFRTLAEESGSTLMLWQRPREADDAT